MKIEPIPEEILPEELAQAVLRGPKIDSETGRVTEGPWQGKTIDEVIRERDAYDRMF
jgi:hypothetical protein